jgi:hypothetical protein
VGYQPEVAPYAREHEAFHDWNSTAGLPRCWLDQMRCFSQAKLRMTQAHTPKTGSRLAHSRSCPNQLALRERVEGFSNSPADAMSTLLGSALGERYKAVNSSLISEVFPCALAQ